MTTKQSTQNAPHRQTEGARDGEPAGAALSKKHMGRGRLGRPAGSKNRPKGILPTELANQILLQMKEMLPEEHYQYMRGVIKDGKAISTKTELDTLILLLSRNLYPALVMEQISEVEAEESPDEFFDDDPTESTAEKVVNSKLKMPVFRKDVTERLKVLQGLLSLRNQVEKRDSDTKVEEKPVLRIFAGRGIDTSRFRVLVGVESGPMVGDTDGVGQPAIEARTVSDQIPERPELLSVGEQGTTDWVLSGDRSGGSVQRSNDSGLPRQLHIDQPDRSEGQD